MGRAGRAGPRPFGSRGGRRCVRVRAGRLPPGPGRAPPLRLEGGRTDPVGARSRTAASCGRCGRSASPPAASATRSSTNAAPSSCAIPPRPRTPPSPLGDRGVRLSDRALAQAAQHASEERLHLFFGADGVEVRRGDGWFAVRTGVDSNDMNGVVSTPGAKVSAVLVADLLAWLAGAPASWLTSRGDPELTDLLLAAGARPERSGCWSGRWVEPVPAHRNGVEVCRVRITRDLDRWIDLAAECGWIETASGRGARRRLYLARAGTFWVPTGWRSTTGRRSGSPRTSSMATWSISVTSAFSLHIAGEESVRPWWPVG